MREFPGDTRPNPARPNGTPRRVDSDAESAQRDLMRLVLTIVELIRQLMERQALRRIDRGDVTDEQTEDLGLALLRLDEAMAELRERFGFAVEDLNLDLGPLGPLLPRDESL